MWKIVSSDRYSVPSPEVVMSQWTLDDVVDAIAMLAVFERLEAKASAKMRSANGSS